MVEKIGSRGGDSAFRAVLENVLEMAAANLAIENAAELERTAKAISALAAARRALAELANETALDEREDNEEHSLAELRRRIARFVEADLVGAPIEVLERIAKSGAAR